MKKKIAKIADLQAIHSMDNGEELVLLKEICSGIRTEYRRIESGLKNVLVRKTVADKLVKVQRELEFYDDHLQLLVVEGYRQLDYQEKYFLQELHAQFQAYPSLDLETLLEHTHQFVALPSIAGHPTGGAVDLTLAHAGEEVEMGGKIADFSLPQLLPTYSHFVTAEQAKWRYLLHDLMVKEGFAPFYGEWWHFSYGDREWAAFYHRPEALYSSTRVRVDC